MNYLEFEKNVASFMDREDLAFFTSSPKYGDCVEPHFSWSTCDCCGSTLGGNRTTYAGVTTTYEHYNFDICDNCVYYNEYKRLDDTTMMKVLENSEFQV